MKDEYTTDEMVTHVIKINEAFKKIVNEYMLIENIPPKTRDIILFSVFSNGTFNLLARKNNPHKCLEELSMCFKEFMQECHK